MTLSVSDGASVTRTVDDEFDLVELPDLASAREEWQELALRSGNVFATWEWASTWDAHFRSGRPLALHACRDREGKLVAILPLYLAARRPVHLLRLLGHGPADELGPVCAPGDVPAVAHVLPRLVAERPLGASAVVLERLSGAGGWRTLLEAPSISQESSPVLHVRGRSWAEFLASCSRNLREQAGRRERKLAREHSLSFRLTQDPDRLDADLSTLFALHALRWREHARAFSGAREAFHRDFARVALARGWLRLWIAEVDGAPAAAWYGFRFAGSDWYYNAGRDPAWDRYSLGFVLLTHTIRCTFVDGLHSYRFLLGPEEYKSRFADDDPGLDTLVLGHGLSRELVTGGAALVRRLRRLGLPRRLIRSLE